jgi:hypothetical protein
MSPVPANLRESSQDLDVEGRGEANGLVEVNHDHPMSGPSGTLEVPNTSALCSAYPQIGPVNLSTRTTTLRWTPQGQITAHSSVQVTIAVSSSSTLFVSVLSSKIPLPCYRARHLILPHRRISLRARYIQESHLHGPSSLSSAMILLLLLQKLIRHSLYISTSS